MQIKRLGSFCSFEEHKQNFPGDQGHACPKSHQEGHFEEAICAILSQPQSQQVCSDQTVGPGHKLSYPQRVLDFCCTCIKLQSLVLNYYIHVDSLVIEHFLVKKHQRCRNYKAHCLIHPYRSIICHTGPILSEKEQTVPKVDVAQKKLKKQKFVTHE